MLVSSSAEETRSQTGKVDICVMYSKTTGKFCCGARLPVVKKSAVVFTGDRRFPAVWRWCCTLRAPRKS